MPRYTSADYLAFWRSIPGDHEAKKDSLGGPYVFAREEAAYDAELSNAEIRARDDAYRIERDTDIAIRSAFEVYFATTAEGKEEGRWLNVVNWQWAAAGRPKKIPVGGHPERGLIFERFRVEWLAHRDDGTKMTMVAPVEPGKRQWRRAI